MLIESPEDNLTLRKVRAFDELYAVLELVYIDFDADFIKESLEKHKDLFEK